MNRTRPIILPILGLVALAFTASHGPIVQTASADTQYRWINGVYAGVGKTYQNNYEAQCRWFDYPGHTDPGPCYKGVWSDTDHSGSQVRVQERAEKVDYTCWDLQNCGGVFYVPHGAAASDSTATSYVSTSHYYEGWGGGSFPVNVRGWANHYNLSVNAYAYWTTSDGY